MVGAHVVGGGKSLGVCVLLESRDPTITNSEGHHPAVIERATGILNSAAGPTDHQKAATFRYKPRWFEGLDSNVRVEVLKKIGHAARTFVGAGVVGYCAWQVPDHVFGN